MQEAVGCETRARGAGGRGTRARGGGPRTGGGGTCAGGAGRPRRPLSPGRARSHARTALATTSAVPSILQDSVFPPFLKKDNWRLEGHGLPRRAFSPPSSCEVSSWMTARGLAWGAGQPFTTTRTKHRGPEGVSDGDRARDRGAVLCGRWSCRGCSQPGRGQWRVVRLGTHLPPRLCRR